MSSEVDLAGLQKELVEALNAEKKYERENDAKFRAVHQKVATYEEFRDIVKAAHLQPLERRDVIGNTRHQPWNALYSKEDRSGDVSTELLSTSTGIPATGQELLRQWRSLKGDQIKQYHLLMAVPCDIHTRILKTEASISILGELLTVLQKFFDPCNVESMLSILLTLSKTPRFSLSLSLLSKSEQESAISLTKSVLSISASTDKEFLQEQLKELKESYNIH